MKPLPMAYPRDLVGMCIIVIAAGQHNALIGTMGMDPDAMTPLSRPHGISALPKNNFQSTDFHIFPAFLYPTMISVFTLDYERWSNFCGPLRNLTEGQQTRIGRDSGQVVEEALL